MNAENRPRLPLMGPEEFIRSAARTGPDDDLARFYRDMNQLRRQWDDGPDLDVEMSIKLRAGRVCYQRCVLPMLGGHNRGPDKVDRVLEALGAPWSLRVVSRTRHQNLIGMMTGMDREARAKRAYFYHGDLGFGYDFRDHGPCRISLYVLVPADRYPAALGDLRRTAAAEDLFNAVMEVAPLSQWSQVCEKKSGNAGDPGRTAYDISTTPSRPLHAHAPSLHRLASRLLSDSQADDFRGWLDDHGDAVLHWFGIGADPDHGLEITLYVRRT